MKRTHLLMTLVACALPMSAQAAEPAADMQFFENKIRPILAANCYRCHSAAEGKMKGDLALDSKQGVLKGSKKGPVIVPGHPEKSLLIKAVGYMSDDLLMPPGGPLTDQQIADLTQWVKMGAPDPRDGKQIAAKGKLTGLTDTARGHWAYQPVKKPAEPAVKLKSWGRTPIDAFILAKLEENGMKPTTPADKATLLRRATFDLIGMPPTTEELQAFLADNSPDAFAKVVDRLLESPHYGERWGRHWLDTVRYADTKGPQFPLNRGEDYRFSFAWVYRDYVIDAFNSDKPYDQFILEQIAADKLPQGKDKFALAGLGFLTVGERFGKTDDIINERIDAVSKGFLGLTVACARCHDHMFDPIPTADFYSLHGVFNNVYEPKETPIVSKPNAYTADYHARRAALEQKNRDIYYQTIGKAGSLFRKKAATYVLAIEALRDASRTQTAKLRQDLMARHGLEQSLLTLPPSIRSGGTDSPIWGPLMRFRQLKPDEFATRGKALAAEIAANAPDKKRGRYNPLVAAMFKDAAPESLGQVEALYNALFAGIEPQALAYLKAKSKSASADIPGYDAALVQLIETPYAIARPAELTTIALHDHAKHLPRLRELDVYEFNALNELDLTHPGAPGRAMILADVSDPKDSPILIRGQIRDKGEIVPRRFLEVLSGPNRKDFKEGSGRLELARAIASKDNPLTVRVAVNRIWMHHFGEGFVPTPDDLGVQSEKPSHPELLDWLASTFMENGWSHKKLHRLILLSSVYQQSFTNNADSARIDPGNRLLWRANIRRLEFEAVRDSLLVFSGNLDSALGGNPVNLTDEPYSYRRSIYGYIDRGRVSDLLQQFDFTDPRMPSSKRSSTIVPQQALFLMNSPMVVDVAIKLAARKEFVAAKDDSGRIAALYQIVFQRQPRPEEIEIGLAYVKDFDSRLTSRTGKVGDSGKTKPPPDAKTTESKRPISRKPVQNEGRLVERRPLTAWEEYAQALMLTNEVAFVK